VFTFCFTLLAGGASLVMGLGGFCASGGAYVIQTQCPDIVTLTTPGSIFGGLIAVGIGVALARGFGTPLVSWAWPILFIGLGGQFFAGAFIDGRVEITNIFLGLMFVVMGFVPLWWSIRAGVQPFLLGNANPADQQFTYRDAGRKSYFAPTYAKGAADPIPPTPADWALTLGILVVAIGLGGWLSVLAFNAVGSAG
jgi:hypothetical protein